MLKLNIVDAVCRLLMITLSVITVYPKCAIGQQHQYDYTLYDAVERHPITLQRYFDWALERYPKADLRKFPLSMWKVDTAKISRILVGQKLPDELLDMPLFITNDAYGRDTTTLRQEMDKEWLILDIWSHTCPPCIHSMNKWEGFLKEPSANFCLLGLFGAYSYQASFETRRKGYQSAQIVGLASSLLIRMFLGPKATLGPSIWIRDGKLFGISNAMALRDQDYIKLFNGELEAIPDYAAWKD